MRTRPAQGQYARLSWLIVAMSLVVLVFGLIAARYVESRLVASKGESLALAASEIAHKLDLLLAEQYDDALELSRAHLFLSRDTAAQSAYLVTVKTIHPIYLWLGVTDAAGRIVAATDPASIGQNRSGSAWFQAARDTGNVHVGDVQSYIETGGTDAVSFTAPIRGAGGEFQGTATTRVGLPALEDVVARTIRTFQTREESRGNLEYKFMTAAGDVFVDSDLFHKGNINLKQIGLPSALLSESDRAGYLEEEHLQRHVPVVTGYARTRGAGEFPGLKWTVLLRIDRDDLVAPIRSMLWKLAAAWILVWMPMLGFSLWSTARLRKESTRAQDEHVHALKAESNYRQLVEQASDIIYRVDLNGYFTYINPTVTRFKGYTQEELIGQHFTEHIRPDAREAARRFYMRQFARKTPSTYYEFPVTKKDGGEIWLGQNVELLVEHGRVVGFQAVARDITDRKRAEEALAAGEKRLRTILEAEPECVKVTTEDGVLLDMNPAGLAMIEAESLEQVRGRSILTVVTPECRDAFADFNRRVHRGESGTMQFEIVGLKGRRRWMDTHAVPLRNESNATIGVLAITRDITERKREKNILQALLEGTASVTGGQFFPALVRALTRTLGVRHALVTELLEGEQPRLRMLAIWMGDRLASPTEYDLVRTPCEKVIQLGEAYYQHSVQELFPEDKDLVALGAVSYLGIALVSSAGKTIGHLCILDDKPLPAADHLTPILKIFASRAAAELERKQTEEESQRSRAFLGSIVENLPNMIFVKDASDLRFVRINKAGEELLGYGRENLIGRNDYDFFPKEEADFFTAKDRAVLQSKELLDIPEEPVDTRHRGTRVLHTKKIPILDKEGRPQYLLGISEDITERKRAEEVRERLVAELAESRNRFEMFFRQTPSAISITTVKDGRFLDVNKQAEVLTGYSRNELIGRTTVGMNLYVDPADRPRLVHDLKEKGLVTNLERQIRTKSGEIRTAVFSLVPIEMGAEPCLLSIAHDITERKRAEQGLRERSRQQAIEAELSLLAVTSQSLPSLLDTAVKLVSNALEANYCEVLEVLPNSTDLRLCASAGWRGDHIGQVKAAGAGSLPHAALRSNKPVLIQDLPAGTHLSGPPWLKKQEVVSGMSVAIHGTEAPWGVLAVYMTKGRVFSNDDVNFLQTVSSILATAIKRMQAESVLRGANQTLRLLSRQLLRVQEDDRRTIARDLHDEIGQSLTAIKLNVERAQRTTDRDARSRIMQDCAQITERVLGQVRDLSLDLHPSILDDLGLAYALKWYANRQAERAGLKVDVAADASLPRLPQDVEIACFRIAQEALTNVVRHAQASQASITLKRGAAAVELCIHDDGIGFVTDTISSPANGGTSIGLTSMQERAKLLGGSVKITSAPRCGTKVIATLPLLVVSPASMPKEEAPRS